MLERMRLFLLSPQRLRASCSIFSRFDEPQGLRKDPHEMTQSPKKITSSDFAGGDFYRLLSDVFSAVRHRSLRGVGRGRRRDHRDVGHGRRRGVGRDRRLVLGRAPCVQRGGLCLLPILRSALYG